MSLWVQVLVYKWEFHMPCPAEDQRGHSDGDKSQGLTQISYIRSPANPCCMLLLEIREESVCLFDEY